MNYNGKIMKAVANSEYGEVSGETCFHYYQDENILTGIYSGGKIIKGQLIGLVNPDGSLDYSYQHLNDKTEIKSGVCHAEPEVLPNGKIRLHEKWQWHTGDKSAGTSIVEEI